MQYSNFESFQNIHLCAINLSNVLHLVTKLPKTNGLFNILIYWLGLLFHTETLCSYETILFDACVQNRQGSTGYIQHKCVCVRVCGGAPLHLRCCVAKSVLTFSSRSSVWFTPADEEPKQKSIYLQCCPLHAKNINTEFY